MALRWGALGALVVAWATWVGCQQQEGSFGPPPPCISDAGACQQHSGGAAVGAAATTTSTGTGTSTGVGGGTTQLTGTVALITSPDFTGATAYLGVANIVAPGPTGNVTVPYGGSSAGTTFDLPGISSGPQWLLVQDSSNGGANIFSTYSFVNLPIATAVTLPVVEAGMLTSIANSLPSVAPQGVSTLASQIVINVTHAGQPYKGVSLNGSAGGATVVYDIASGSYSDTATATGSSGIIILFNSALSGGSLIGLKDNNTSSLLSVQVMAAPGAVSLVGAAL